MYTETEEQYMAATQCRVRHNNSLARHFCIRSTALCSKANRNKKFHKKETGENLQREFLFHVKRQALWSFRPLRTRTSLSHAAASFSGPSTFGEAQHSVQPTEAWLNSTHLMLRTTNPGYHNTHCTLGSTILGPKTTFTIPLFYDC